MMTSLSPFRRLLFGRTTLRARRKHPAVLSRLRLEVLEDRCLPSVSTLQAGYGNLPLAFEANQGQAPAGVDYLTHGSGYTLSLTSHGAVLGLGKGSVGMALGLILEGANPAAPAVGQDPLITKSNYLVGSDPSRWHTNIPNYGRVEYRDVYPGIDLAYYGNQGQLEYDFLLAPGADPAAIRLGIQGALSVSLDGQSELVLHTAAGDLIEQAPVLYQDMGGVRHTVSGRFLLEGGNQVGFQVGPYDHSRPLVIDPTLCYASYLPGTGTAIAVDGSGDAYITGSVSGNYNLGLGVFVDKLNAAGTALVYQTFLGSSSSGHGSGIAVDAAGDAYVTGIPGANFPTTANALNTTATASGFLTVLNPAGSGLLYSTFIPGFTVTSQQSIAGPSLAIASAGSGLDNVYVSGEAGAGLPTTASAFQPSLAGTGINAFFAQFNPNLSGSASLPYASYLGGTGGDTGTGIAVDGSGNAYMTGYTTSSDFPTTPGAFQTQLGGLTDCFVAKFNPSLSRSSSLVYSTYLGGSRRDGGFGALSVYPYETNSPAIAVDSSGDAYVTGVTVSTNFPTTPGAYETSNQNQNNFSGTGFVTKLKATGTGLVYSTYLGGTTKSGDNSIALDGYGNAYVTGYALATPTSENSDVLVTTLNAAGSGLLYSATLGGSTEDIGFGISLDTAGNLYVTGGTNSSNFPTTAGAYQTTGGGGFVFKITTPVGPSFAVTGFPTSITAGTSGTITVTALNADGSVNTGYRGTVHFTSSDPHAVLPPDTTLTNGTGIFSVTLVTAGTQSITVSDASNSGITGSETGITVSPAAATHFVLSGSTTITAGTAFNLMVTAVDAYGNTATAYTGTVHFSDSVGGATLPGNYTFQASDQGVHTFSKLKLKTKGVQTITVMDTLNNSILGTWTIDVT
jgi:hypothetical protein